MKSPDCDQTGHLWLEGTSIPDDPRARAAMPIFARHRGRPRGPVAVICWHCRKTTTLEGHSPFIAPPRTLARLAIDSHEA